jgi:hypothetical protein
MDRLMNDLAATASWAGTMPDEGHMLVTLLGGPDDGTIRVHPLGGLTVHERSVPLELTIDRFGTSAVAGARRFEITAATIGGAAADITPITDRFAPGQFLALSDDQLLARPAFEELTAGARITQGANSTQSGSQTGDLSYLTFLIDDVPVLRPMPTAPMNPIPDKGYAINAEVMAALAGTGPAARYAPRVPGARQLAGAGAPMTAPGWTVAGTDDLKMGRPGHPLSFGRPTSHAQAAQALAEHEAANPAEKGRWQVVERHEAMPA